MNPILELLQKNAWPILIAIIGLIVSYTMIDARVSQLERDVAQDKAAIELIKSSNNQTAIDIAQIQKDIEYIRLQLNRVFPPVSP